MKELIYFTIFTTTLILMISYWFIKNINSDEPKEEQRDGWEKGLFIISVANIVLTVGILWVATVAISNFEESSGIEARSAVVKKFRSYYK